MPNPSAGIGNNPSIDPLPFSVLLGGLPLCSFFTGFPRIPSKFGLNCGIPGLRTSCRISPFTHGFSPRVLVKKHWILSQNAFQQFLDCLDEGADSGGEKYLEMRRRLVSYFDRRNCASPDELADETLNRVARKLEELGRITDSARPGPVSNSTFQNRTTTTWPLS